MDSFFFRLIWIKNFYIFHTRVTGINVAFIKRKIPRVGFLEKQCTKEEYMELYILIGFLAGLFLGLIFPHKSSGTLKIDHSNPEKDVYRFEVDNLDKLNKKRKIVLKIDNNADLSQN